MCAGLIQSGLVCALWLGLAVVPEARAAAELSVDSFEIYPL